MITLEVPLTLLIASRVFGSRLGHVEWTGILVMTGGAILLIAMLNPQPGDETHVSDFLYAAAGGSTAGTIVILIALAQRGHTLWRTGCLGAAAGTSFGLTATLIKETARGGGVAVGGGVLVLIGSPVFAAGEDWGDDAPLRTAPEVAG